MNLEDVLSLLKSIEYIISLGFFRLSLLLQADYLLTDESVGAQLRYGTDFTDDVYNENLLVHWLRCPRDATSTTKQILLQFVTAYQYYSDDVYRYAKNNRFIYYIC